uniref:RING-type domain-containing protein n=1 Tax=Branchiostoma floridae TaxID=7739 RepID=C3Y1C5_BRAFL|eukprot:XP_002609655.1 hypothetical protein BRAFLDRAFT_83655 [Branchiostoma floridae]
MGTTPIGYRYLTKRPKVNPVERLLGFVQAPACQAQIPAACLTLHQRPETTRTHHSRHCKGRHTVDCRNGTSTVPPIDQLHPPPPHHHTYNLVQLCHLLVFEPTEMKWGLYSAVAFVFSTLWMLLYGICSIIMIPIHILILSSPLLFMYLINQPDANHIVRWLQETARSVQTFIRDMFVEYQSRQQPLPNPSVQSSPLGFTAYPTVSSAPRTEVPADAEGWEFHEHLLQPRRSGRLSSLRRHFFIEDTENDNSCVVCLDRPANMTLRPCGHRCVCRRCAWRILNPRVGEDGGKCPLDRQPIFVAVPDRICVIM